MQIMGRGRAETETRLSVDGWDGKKEGKKKRKNHTKNEGKAKQQPQDICIYICLQETDPQSQLHALFQLIAPVGDERDTEI